MKFIGVQEGETVCANCAHYIQHYTLSRYTPGGLLAVNAGHCTYPRIKDRKPGACACEHFAERKRGAG